MRANAAELRVGHLGVEPRANGLRSRQGTGEGGEITGSSAESADGRPSSSPVVAGGGQSVGNDRRPDAVELALAEALTRASAAGEWAVVETLGAELANRRQRRGSDR